MNGDDETEGGLPPHLSAEFYLWLWYTSEVDRGAIDLGGDAGEVQFWVDDRIAFRSPGEDKATTVLSGERPTDAPEARAALGGGKVLREVRLVLMREEREYTLTLRGPGMTITGAKLPGQVKTGDVAEILYDRMFLYEEMHFVLAALFRRFAEERTSASWHTGTLPGLRRWVAGRTAADELDDEGAGA